MKNNMKKILLVFLIFSMLLILISCGGNKLNRETLMNKYISNIRIPDKTVYEIIIKETQNEQNKLYKPNYETKILFHPDAIYSVKNTLQSSRVEYENGKREIIEIKQSAETIVFYHKLSTDEYFKETMIENFSFPAGTAEIISQNKEKIRKEDYENEQNRIMELIFKNSISEFVPQTHKDILTAETSKKNFKVWGETIQVSYNLPEKNLKCFLIFTAITKNVHYLKMTNSEGEIIEYNIEYYDRIKTKPDKIGCSITIEQ